MKKDVAVGQHYLVSFKLLFLTYQSNIRELWVVPQVLRGSGSVVEVILVWFWFGIYAQILGMYAAAAASNQAKLKGYPGLRLAHPDSK